ncbi:hypothetical protein [Kitasatospora mediocidica]|uniref:hypothetical protein n=1 Tax=Kitasatospora mediocidica TaxID=58352 RepID=UPI00055ECE0B|nr:hypothetical protein [Kitasatospora mediocidica]
MARARSISYLQAGVLLAAVGVLATGCSHSAATSAGPGPAGAPTGSPAATSTPLPRPAVGAIPVLDSTVGKSMPIERYLFSVDQAQQVTEARNRLAAQCMQRYGLTYAPPPVSQSGPGGQATHRYDVVDPANGYRSPTPADAKLPPPPQLRPAELTVLAGSGPAGTEPITTYGGLPIPKGGCLGEAEAKLTANGGAVVDDQLAININFDNYRRSMTDDKLLAAFHQWSACMKTKGFSYPAPTDAMGDKRWKGSATPSAAEIATATADASCRQQANVVGTWFTVESAYEEQAIQADLGQLDRVQQGIAAVLKNTALANGDGAL